MTPPHLDLTERPPSEVEGATVVALAVLTGDDGPELGPGAAELAEEPGAVDLLDVLESAGASGVPGEVTELHGVRRGDAVVRLLLVGAGQGTSGDLRRAGAALARGTRDVDHVASAVSAVTTAVAAALATISRRAPRLSARGPSARMPTAYARAKTVPAKACVDVEAPGSAPISAASGSTM